MGLQSYFRANALEKKYARQFRQSVARDEDGRMHVPCYTSFFSEMNGTVMRSYSDYANFRKEINASLEPFKVQDPVVIDVFELTPSTEFDRETATIGFRKYISACYSIARRDFIRRQLLFFSFLIIGIVIITMLYGVLSDLLPPWLFYCIETIGTVFIWQFAGYVVFERHSERKNLIRLKQMIKLEFDFKRWE